MLTGASAFESSSGHIILVVIIRIFYFMPFYVYILYSEAFDKFYVGQTNDVYSRLARHNSGTEKATLPYRPWKLIWFAEKTSRAQAILLLKNLSKERLHTFIIKYS